MKKLQTVLVPPWGNRKRNKYRIILHSVGVLTILSAWLLLCTEGMAMFILLKYIIIITFGYVASVLDIKTRCIPNGLVLGMLAVWLVIMAVKLLFNIEEGIRLLVDSLFGLLVGGGLFILVYLLSRKGLGGGDVKFMAAAGLFLGVGKTIPAMLYGSVLAALTGLVLILLKKIGRRDTMPLAPFLYAGILISVFII
jgi:prepilin signal peptidase PulO-like enzyme (type II secretory pathway)